MKLTWIIRLVAILFLLLLAVSAFTQETQQEFKSVKIGDMEWMAENLNIDRPGGYCYKNNPAYCNKYGRLYIWGIALKACPSGWHLPTLDEWQQLGEALGGMSVAGGKLKAGGGSGMDVPLTGLKKEEGFDYFGIDSETGFWTASAANPKQVYVFYVRGFTDVLVQDLATIGMGMPVRCVKDKTASADTDASSK